MILPEGQALPTSIGRYRIEALIARGGAGAVYRAKDPAAGRSVAIKLLLGGRGASDTQRKRFEREIKALAKLSHPNIVPV